MDMIKDEILSSDLFIIASPVFIHNVPGSIKNLIDRLGYWTHLMRLTGKLGMVATISDNTGNEQVIKYLEKVMNYWGVAKLSSIDIKTVNMTDDAFDSYARYAAQNILNYYNDPIELIEPIQEKIFSNQKDQLKSKPLKTSEYNFWSDNKYFEYSSFKDLFSNKQSRPIKI